MNDVDGCMWPHSPGFRRGALGGPKGRCTLQGAAGGIPLRGLWPLALSQDARRGALQSMEWHVPSGLLCFFAVLPDVSKLPPAGQQKSTAADAAMPFLFAEAEGFEPPERSHVQQFSRLPPSTTRPHLQRECKDKCFFGISSYRRLLT